MANPCWDGVADAGKGVHIVVWGYYAVFLDCTLVYCLIYGSAFRIHELCKRANVALRPCVSTSVGKVGRRAMLAQMRSIPAVGIKVGTFHMMERTSTPIFLHYVLNNVVSMLVAYE